MNKYNQFISVYFIESLANLLENYSRRLPSKPDILKLHQNFIAAYDRMRMLEDCPAKLTHDLRVSLSSLQLHFRHSFARYFMEVCHKLKNRSNCIKRAAGALLAKNNRIISTSYNGSPATNCFEGGCRECWESTSEAQDGCFCIHAEYGAILEAGIANARGTTLYTTNIPCKWCCKIIIQAKLAMLIYDDGDEPNAKSSLARLRDVMEVYQLEELDK